MFYLCPLIKSPIRRTEALFNRSNYRSACQHRVTVVIADKVTKALPKYVHNLPDFRLLRALFTVLRPGIFTATEACFPTTLVKAYIFTAHQLYAGIVEITYRWKHVVKYQKAYKLQQGKTMYRVQRPDELPPI